MRRHKIQQPKQVHEGGFYRPPIFYKNPVPYQSLYNLNVGIKELISRLPTDIDLVAGIPRCGMIPATLIAMYWSLPLTDVYSLCEKKLYKHCVIPDKWDISKVRKVLVVDDTLATGRNMAKVKDLIKASGLKLEIIYAVIYATEETKNDVDYYVEIIPIPRIHEWDLAQDKSFHDACVDIDGVLCRNPTKEEQSTPEKYTEFLNNVNPLLRPPGLHTIITGRLEKYRPETEAWLGKQGIKFDRLMMIPEPQDHGKWKASIYQNLDNKLFFESSEKEAEIIAQTGKQVIVPFLPVRKLNILTHIGIVKNPSGASITICTVSSALSRRSHTVKISQPPENLPYMPVDSKPLMVSRQLSQLYRQANMILVHWRSSPQAIKLTQKLYRPRVHFFCDRNSPARLGVTDAALVVFNSYWLMKDTGWQGEQMVIYPPVYPEFFKTIPGDGILLVSPHKTKGIDIFLELAKRMPDRKFIIAQGRGITLHDLPSNIEFIKPTIDPRDIYSRVRLVLMPSREGIIDLSVGDAMWSEGYGRVAIEAATSGIPTIGSRESLGLQECLGPGGMFAGQDNIDEWIELIEKLDNKDFYAEKSEYAFKLSQERHPDKQINELEERLVNIYTRL